MRLTHRLPATVVGDAWHKNKEGIEITFSDEDGTVFYDIGFIGGM